MQATHVGSGFVYICEFWACLQGKLDRSSESWLLYDLWVVFHSFELLSRWYAMPKAVNIVVLGGSRQTPGRRHLSKSVCHSKQRGRANQSVPSSGAYDYFTNVHWLEGQARPPPQSL